METRRRSRSPSLWSRCQCSQSLPLFSSFIFLAAILPRSSLAQVDDPRSTNAPTPTTLRTSISSSPIPSSSTLTPSTAQSNPPAAQTSSTTESQISDKAFNYYFLIVAAVAITFCLCILYIGKRRKRKAAIMRSNSERALARDVEGFRGRFGIRRPGFSATTITREDTIEGLNERGEAPPPYMPGSKPPSLRDDEGTIRPPNIGSGTAAGEPVELRRITRLVDGPPGYNEHASESTEGDMGIARPFGAVTIANDDSNLPRPYTALTAPDERSGLSRPDTAVTASGSTRRLLNSSAGSGHEGV